MREERIRSILTGGEHETVEFKQALTQVPESLYETICAFLNHKGGDILLGVDDDGQVIGIPEDKADAFCLDIANATNNNTLFSPPYLLYPQKLLFEGKWIIAVQVPESSQVHRLRNMVYSRGASGDYRVTVPEHIAKIVNRKRTFYSEAKVYPYLHVSDLDEKTLQKTRERIRNIRPNHPWLDLSTEDFLRKAGLYCRDLETGTEGLCLAAALLFGKEETILNILPFYKIDALLKRSNVDRYDDRCYVQSNIIEAYLQLMEFIERHLPDPFYLEGDVRISLRDKIFRELVANLLVHREYTKADQTRILIYQDRVEFSNPCIPHWRGRIDPSSVVPFQKNPLLSKMFLQLGWVEEIGSGLMNVMKYLPLYTRSGHAEILEDEDFRVIVFLEATEQATPQATPQAPSDRIATILEFCKIPRSREEIQDMLGLKDREHFRKEILEPLIITGKLELTIPDKPRSPHQKYVTKGYTP